ncbi:MAG: DUF4974 domain-containing protein [Bacteroidales bacterium]|jgi:ferric-dicitrate binding protein FerR (iron transport regulator)|nr:DUF4974 domain-containing protein [Bacteroidales bacterium]
MKSDFTIGYLTEAFLHRGLTAREKTAMQQLLKAPDNRRYFGKVYAIWHVGAGRFSGEAERALQKALYRIRRSPVVAETRRMALFGRIAAALLVSFTLGALLYHIFSMRQAVAPSPEAGYSKITVPCGAKSQVTLPDGTVVDLNAGSNLYYETSYGETVREVRLEGEGYFKVAENKPTAFVVKAKNVTVKALGTEFNVKAYAEEKTVQTTLVSGRVSITREKNGRKTREYTLQPRQTITVFDAETTGNDRMAVMQTSGKKPVNMQANDKIGDCLLENNVKTEIYTSWKDARWVIESEQLCELAVKLQRRYDVRIVISDEELKKYPFTGILTDETLEQVLDIMASVAPIRYGVDKKEVCLSIHPQQRKIFEASMKNR